MKKQITLLVKKLLSLLGLRIQRIMPADDNHRWLDRYNIKTVLDIGANVGQSAVKMAEIFPDAAILSFEPLDECHRQLVARMKGRPRFQAFKCALGEDNDSIVIHHNEFNASSSILPIADLHKKTFPKTENAIDETVEVRTLDSVLDDVQSEDNILVKMDVQGYEANVIRGGKQTISRAAVIIIETSFRELYKDQPLFGDIYDMLKDLGFRYAGTRGAQLMNPTNGSVLQADSIFINTRFDTGR